VDRPAPPPGAQGALIVNGELRDSAPIERDFEGIVATVRELLAELGERLEPGDRLITGSVVQIPLNGADRVIADLGPLGRVELSIA
jgi:2-keto-4-pentenoate hydratase